MGVFKSSEIWDSILPNYKDPYEIVDLFENAMIIICDLRQS